MCGGRVYPWDRLRVVWEIIYFYNFFLNFVVVVNIWHLYWRFLKIWADAWLLLLGTNDEHNLVMALLFGLHINRVRCDLMWNSIHKLSVLTFWLISCFRLGVKSNWALIWFVLFVLCQRVATWGLSIGNNQGFTWFMQSSVVFCVDWQLWVSRVASNSIYDY